MDWSDEDPGLPIKFGPCSNAEYDPEPVLPEVLLETIRRAREAGDRHARRLGMSRREFLLSICGAATTLTALNACTREAHLAEPSRVTCRASLPSAFATQISSRDGRTSRCSSNRR